MMQLRKNKLLWVGFALVVAYLGTRLYNILALPIFTDEAIYVRWTQIFVADIHQFFVPLTDGKQPLYIWLGYPFLKVFSNPLLGLRLVSVFAGFLTMVGIYLLTKELFQNKKAAVVASLLYIIFPFALVYDKLALYDSLLATFAVWSLYMEVLLVRRRKLYLAVLAAGIFGAAMLTKSSAFFFLYLLPFSLLLFDFKSKTRNRDLLKWLGFAILAFVGALACYAILRFSPNYHYITDKNYMFIDPPSVWIKHPFARIPGNTRILLKALVEYATLPLLFLSASSFVVKRRYFKEKLLLLIWFAAPMSALILFGNPLFLFPRYILFMTMPLLVLAAFSLVEFYEIIKGRSKYLAVAAVILLLLPMLHKDFYILTDFSRAPIAKVDKEQLVTSFTAGLGVQQTVDFLNEKSKNGPIYIGTQGLFGLMPESLKVYLNDNKNVQIDGYWPIADTPPQTVLDAAKIKPTYFIFYAPCPACSQEGVAPARWPLKQVFQIERSEKGSYFTLYEVIPQ